MSESRTPIDDKQAIELRAWSLPRITIEHLWLSIPVLLVVCFGFLLKLRLIDFWWHLKAGEIIVNTRSIPDTDLFSFTAAGQRFVLQNWLVEIIYYAVYRIGGLALVVALNAGLLVAAFLPVYQLCRRATDKLRLSVLAALVPAILLLYFGSVRSQVFSFVLFSVFYWVLSQYFSRERDLLWLLPPAVVIWVNVHGAFVLGLVLMLLFLGSEIVRRFLYPDLAGVLSARELRKLAIVIAVTALATIVNPETYRIYSYIRTVATNPASQAFVLEWQPPRINEAQGVVLFYGPFFITLAVMFMASRRPQIIESLLVLVFSIMGLSAVRNGVWFALIAAPIIARYIPTVEMKPLLDAAGRFRLLRPLVTRITEGPRVTPPVRYRLNRQIAVLLATITILVTPWVYPHLGNPAFGDTLWEKTTPVGAMDFIKQQSLVGNIFHPQVYGDYLIWRLWPEQRSFVDGRVHLFPDSVIRDYRLSFNDSHWEERLARYDIRFLLLSKDEEENRMMLESARDSSSWRIIYEDSQSVLFEHTP